MIPVRQQIEKGLLVCPRTRTALRLCGTELISDAGWTYPLAETGAPVLLSDTDAAKKYASASPQMLREYAHETPGWKQWPRKARDFLRRDYRTKASRSALQRVLDAGKDENLCLSIGGGPLRIAPGVTNLNIGPFPNVDVIGDAHALPYADGAVDAIYCEAVLEHLQEPTTAVAEMFRVLKPGGRVIAITPFLQRFHGYPYHFQNFTLVGHSLLFSRAGFRVVDSGTCVGPTYAVVSLVSAYLTQCVPRIIGLPLAAVWNAAGLCLLPLDLLINRPASSHMLASTTYILAEKPGREFGEYHCNNESTATHHAGSVDGGLVSAIAHDPG